MLIGNFTVERYLAEDDLQSLLELLRADRNNNDIVVVVIVVSFSSSGKERTRMTDRVTVRLIFPDTNGESISFLHMRGEEKKKRKKSKI